MKKIKRLFILLAVLFLTTSVYAAQKYNPYTRKWETTSEDAAIERNPYTGQQSYQPKGSELEYNPFSGKHEWVPPSQNQNNAPQQSGGFQVLPPSGYGSSDAVADSISSGVTGFIKGLEKGREALPSAPLDIEADATIDKNYDFTNTRVFLGYRSDYELIAAQALKVLLERKGWVVTSKEDHDLITIPMFKENNNFNGTGYSYLTMNLYFFKNKKTGDENAVVDAFVAKQVKSRDIKKEIQEMCIAIANKLPDVKRNTSADDGVDFIPDKENIPDEIKRLEQKAEKEGITNEEMDRLEELVKTSKNRNKDQ